jgi:Flp pilus assembly protein TadG
MILFAISMVVLLVSLGVAVDGGFGLVQYRRAQNAADFAAEAAANDLLYNCTLGAYGTSAAAPAQIVSVINNFIGGNNSSVSTTGTPYGWTADYLPAKGQTYATAQPVLVPGTDTAENLPTSAPPCGVSITVTPKWPPFIAQLVGLTNWSAPASASAVNTGAPGSGPLTSIVALAENGEHVILQAGDGAFNIIGTIFDNANGCLSGNPGPTCSSWNDTGSPYSRSNPGEWDVIDEKQSGAMSVQGEIESYVNAPFDTCFGGAAPGANQTAGTAPNTVASCSSGNETISYYDWVGSQGPQYTQATDPVANEVPAPTPADAGCSGASTNGTSVKVGSTTYYYPGVYKSAVVATGNSVFLNCNQTPINLSDTSNASPGIFWFTDGVGIEPASGDTATGSDVLFVAQNPIPDSTSGYTSNVGDGEPAIGNGSGYCDVTKTGETCQSYNRHANPACPNINVPNDPSGNSPDYASAGTNCNSAASSSCIGSGCFGPNSTTAQGLNDSVEIGGDGTVTISAPQTGSWEGFVVWQLASTEANIGIDAESGQNATVNLTGIVYDNSDPTGQDLSAPQYWGGNSSLPFIAGGMLVAGSGLATAESGNTFTGDTLSGGKVTITGMATVDIFQTQGDATLKVTGSTFHLDGIQGSGAILTG